MSKKRIIITFLFFLFCFVSVLPGQSICHAGLTLEGQFMENGEKLKAEQPVKMTVRIYNDEFDGQLLFEENQDVVAGSDKAVFAFEQGNVTVRQRTSGLNTATLWVEVESDGQVMTPRLNLTEIDTVNNLTGESIQLDNASLRAGGTATLLIDNNGVTLGNLLNMGEQFIKLGGVDRKTWPAGGSSTETRITALETQISNQQIMIAAQTTRIEALENLLSHFSRSDDEITISGANLHIVNGTGDTVNSRGNLIIGYNTMRSSGNDRSGSHNLVIGARQNYSSYGGLVAGYYNNINAPYASVSGGSSNTASGEISSISGGVRNTASANNSSICGGELNTASGDYSNISGGYNNTASESYSSISGGYNNTASGDRSSVSGGASNIASGSYSSVSGGYTNTASGDRSSVSGGFSNEASGTNSSISGGFNNAASGTDSSISGGFNNTASGNNSSVSGGDYNEARGKYSSISGGYSGLVFGEDDWKAGSLFEDF